MTTKELIDTLSKYPDDTLVVMSSDAEGNRIHSLDEAEESWYIEWEPGYGDLINPVDLHEYKEAIKVIALWPQ